MKFRILVITLLTMLLTSNPRLAAQELSADFPLTIVDGGGRELTFDAPPQRVVTYYNDSYGMLATLGLMPVAQSVNPEMLTDPIYFDGQGSNIPTIGYTDSHDLEDVAAAHPDLVMVYSVEEAQALEDIAPAFVTYNPTTMEEQYEALRQYGILFGRQAEAEAAITAFQNRLAAYQTLAPGDVSVLKLGAMDGGAFWISTIDDPICQILDTLAVCEWEKATPDEFWGYESTIEGVLALDPDVIILNNWTSGNREDLLAALDADPLWNELRAVQNGRVLGTPGYENPIASSLPAATKFLDTYLPLLYPDVFPEALTEEQVEEIASQSTPSEFPLTIVDGAGRDLTFDEAPQRVVCTYTRCMELLAALEFAPVGVASWVEDFASDPAYFPQPNEIVIIPEDGDVPNLEQIAALQPDLVFGWVELVDALAGIAPVYVVVDGQDSYQESHEEIRMFARLLGREEIAEGNIQSALDRLAAYQALAPRDVSIMYGFFSDGAFSYRDGQSGTCNLLNQVARCDWADPEGSASWSVQINDEALLALNPDVLLISSYGFEGQTAEEVIAALTARPLWAELTAVQTGQVHVITTSPTNMDGMGTVGMAQMLDVLMPLIYPDVFPEALTDEQVQEILVGAS
jgi:iron complex transport system substrate-binding protein